MKKKFLANVLFYTGISYLFFRIRLLTTDIRVVNYHCTPEYSKAQFEKQLKFFNKYFEDVNLEKLSDYFTVVDKRQLKKPGLIISFDDGLRSNFDTALKVLEQYSFTGWFFIPAGFLQNPSKNFALANSITMNQDYTDDRYGMSINEAKYISKNHILGCHTFTHHRMSANDSVARLDFEITNAKLKLEELLGINEIFCFCWVGGELSTYTAEAYAKIKEAGFEYSFATNNLPLNRKSDKYMINRTNLEADYSIQLVIFQLSGIMDLLYYKKRRKIKKLLYNAVD